MTSAINNPRKLSTFVNKWRNFAAQNEVDLDEFDDSSDEDGNFEGNSIGELSGSIEFEQMQLYVRNHKYEKALALIEQMYRDYKEEGEPNTLTFILKQKYQIQVNIERLASRDAEMTLHNIISLIDENIDEY